MYDPESVLKDDRLRDLKKLAVTNFRSRGRAYDEARALPMENLRELHERGWLRATLSPDNGGFGSNATSADPATFWQGLRMIAHGCSSTAHCYQVTNHTAWCLESLGTERQREKFLEPMRKGVYLGAFVGSEPKRKHMYQMTTSARRVSGGYVLNGEKSYATNASGPGFAIIFAAIEGVADYNQNHQMFIVEPDMEGVTMDHDWYKPNGMRAAPSPIITLDNVFVPDENVLGEPGAYPRGRWQGRFHLGFTANYLGTAEGMYEWYLGYVAGRGRGGDPVVQLRTGEMRIQLDAAAAIFDKAITAWKERPVVEAELLSMSAKSMIAGVAFDLSHKIIHAAGSTALFDEFPLSRALRDLETHVLHAGHDRTAQIVGQAQLGQNFDSTLQR